MPTVVPPAEWRLARLKLLQQEKEFTRLRDSITELRRALPWTAVEKDYVFDTNAGRQSLADLFAGNSQLIVYHFMLGPDWAEGCSGCSFWADNFNGLDVHLRHRDTTLLAVSRAPLSHINSYKARMGWSFNWVSSLNNDFNFDFHVSFTPAALQGEVEYNYHATKFPSTEAPGISVFCKDGDKLFHSYSAYARGLDNINAAYQLLDLTPKGRDEDALDFPTAWLRRNDQYND